MTRAALRAAAFLQLLVAAAAPAAAQDPSTPSSSSSQAQLHPAVAPSLPPARLDYTIYWVLDNIRDHLEVDLVLTGLDPAQRDVTFELPLWGEWIDLDEYYVTAVRGAPPVKHDLDNRFYWRPQIPPEAGAWDGRLAIHYEIPIVALGSAAQQAHGLLPWRTGTYVQSYSANTLMRLLVGEAHQDADRHVEWIAPEGWTIATGWGGASLGRQLDALAPAADNTIVFCGRPAAHKTSDGEGGHIEVVQFGQYEDRTGPVLDLARRLRAACTATLGCAAPADEHVFITEPGFGGTHTDGAVVIGHPALGDDGRFDTGTADFIAHELFHAWLPGVLAQGEGGLEWFFEGFTDYLALWHLAHLGVITPQQFADQLRMLELIARQSPACGHVAFADKSVSWREPDNESIAYKGGAILAFHWDVELRAHGEPGLPQLFRDLMRDNGGRYTLAALQSWCGKHGLADAWRDHVAAPSLPDVGDDLVLLGFRETREGDAGESRVIKAGGADLAAFFGFAPRAD